VPARRGRPNATSTRTVAEHGGDRRSDPDRPLARAAVRGAGALGRADEGMQLAGVHPGAVEGGPEEVRSARHRARARPSPPDSSGDMARSVPRGPGPCLVAPDQQIRLGFRGRRDRSRCRACRQGASRPSPSLPWRRAATRPPATGSRVAGRHPPGRRRHRVGHHPGRAARVVVFLGVVRDHAEGRAGVTGLTYEAYEEEAVTKLARGWRSTPAASGPPVDRIALLHRNRRPRAVRHRGRGSSCRLPHRADAFEAAPLLHRHPERKRSPIWKREATGRAAPTGAPAPDPSARVG